MTVKVGDLTAGLAAKEPVAFLLMLMTAVLVFGVSFAKWQDHSFKVWLLGSRLVGSLLEALAFVGILILFYLFLMANFTSFQRIFANYPPTGSPERAKWQETIKGWGSNITQDELTVQHFVERSVLADTYAADGKTLYFSRKVTEEVLEDSIVAFRGTIDIQRLDRPDNDPLFTAYTLVARYEYDVVNQADQTTSARFTFPLPQNHIFQKVTVSMDGEEVPSLVVYSSAIVWERGMEPHQRIHVIVRYSTQGIDRYVYQSTTRQVIQNYTLQINTNSPVHTWTDPQTDTLRSSIENSSSGHDYIIKWILTRQAILSPVINVEIMSGPSKYLATDSAMQLTSAAPRGILFFLSITSLTLIICNVKISLKKIVLLALTYSLLCLGLMGLSFWIHNSIVLLIIFSGLMAVLTYFNIREYSKLIKGIIVILVVLFGVGSSFTGALNQITSNAVDGILQVAIILFIFGLTLFVRISQKQNS